MNNIEDSCNEKISQAKQDEEETSLQIYNQEIDIILEIISEIIIKARRAKITSENGWVIIDDDRHITWNMGTVGAYPNDYSVSLLSDGRLAIEINHDEWSIIPMHHIDEITDVIRPNISSSEATELRKTLVSNARLYFGISASKFWNPENRKGWFYKFFGK